MVAIPRTRTARLLHAECLFCGAEIVITIVGDVGDVRAWLDELPLAAWEYFAEEHGCELRNLRLDHVAHPA